MANEKINKKNTDTTSSPVKWLWRLFFAGVAGVVLVLLLANFGVFGEMPSIEELQNPKASESSLVLADDGSVMGKYYRQDRVNVDFKQISPYVIQALIATEDERFFDHSGIDLRSIGRAVFSLGKDGGASTITMQTAKNLFTDYSYNKFIRVIQKIKEGIIAIKLEMNFTKEEIMTLYLNTVPFSDNVYGIRNASRTFYQKDPDDLTIDEAAVLIGMLKASTFYNPRINPENSLRRRNTVINQMERNKYITSAQADGFKAKPIELNYRKITDATGIAPYFRMVLLNQVKEWCKTHTKPDGNNYDVYKDGLKIYTTINPKMQTYAEEAVSRHLSFAQKILNNQSNIKTGSVWKTAAGKRSLNYWMRRTDRWKNNEGAGMSEEENIKTFNVKDSMRVFAWNKDRSELVYMTPLDSIKYHRQMLQVGFMAMEPLSGAIKAWVGGIDYKTFGYDHVNVGTKRQVGSVIKPLLYCLAIDQGGFTPTSSVVDVQQYFRGFGAVPATGGTCTGRTMTMTSALSWSRNCATAYILKQLNPERNEGAKMFVNFLKLCGIKSKLEPYPSIALGASEISLYEMMKAYSIFPGRGFNVEPMMITRIESADGNVLFQNTPRRAEVTSDMAATQTVTMMQSVVNSGTARGIWGYGVKGELAGKTGTTNDNSDAWYIGYSPQLIAGVWTGCDDRFIRIESSTSGQGSRLAMPIWAYFYEKATKDEETGITDTLKFNEYYSDTRNIFYDWVYDPIPDSAFYIGGIEDPFVGGIGTPSVPEIGAESDTSNSSNSNQPAVGGAAVERKPEPQPQPQQPATPPANQQQQQNNTQTEERPRRNNVINRIFRGNNNREGNNAGEN